MVAHWGKTWPSLMSAITLSFRLLKIEWFLWAPLSKRAALNYPTSPDPHDRSPVTTSIEPKKNGSPDGSPDTGPGPEKMHSLALLVPDSRLGSDYGRREPWSNLYATGIFRSAAKEGSCEGSHIL